jgi:hypothetical protein
MKWERPLSMMKQHEDLPFAGRKGSSANKRHRKESRAREEEQYLRRPPRVEAASQVTL